MTPSPMMEPWWAMPSRKVTSCCFHQGGDEGHQASEDGESAHGPGGADIRWGGLEGFVGGCGELDIGGRGIIDGRGSSGGLYCESGSLLVCHEAGVDASGVD